jgi:hypothetical protein
MFRRRKGSNPKTTRKRWSGLLLAALFSVTVGLGCGSSAADLAPKDCCKSMCQHASDSKDPEQCCQTNKQSRPSLSIPPAEISLAKKVFESALFIETLPLNGLFEGILVERTPVPAPRIFKLPQQELYKLTSALLI